MSAVGGEQHTVPPIPTHTGEGAPTGMSKMGSDVLSAVTEFESRVAAFKALYAQAQTMQLEAEQRRVELNAREAELNSRGERTAEREQELIRIDAELAARRADADAAMAAAENLRAELNAQAQDAEALLEKRQAEVDARAVQIAGVEKRLAERDEKVAERERKAAQAEENARKIREAEQALSQRITELNKRQQQLKDETVQLAEAKRQAAEQAAAVARDRELLAEQQREAEVQAQTLAADRLALEALEREATEESVRLSSLRKELEAKAATLADRDRQLSEDQGRAASDRSEEARHAAAELATARDLIAHERAAQRDLLAVVEEYEQLWILELRESTRLAGLLASAPEAHAEPAPNPEAANTDVADLTQLVEGLKDRLRTEITAARAVREELEHAKSERDAAIKQVERAFAQGKGQAPAREPRIESLERRRRRLKLLRELLRKQALRIRKAGEALKKRYEQVDQVLAQRAELATARNKIIAAEKRLTRSRAASRAAVVVLCGVGVVGLLGAMSWAIAREIAPATFEAVSIVKAEGRERELSAAELHEWQTFHEELLADPRFHESAAERFKRQGNTPLSSAGGVGELITSRVTTESMGDGELRLRLTGTGADPTARTLETLTAGFMAYANSGHGKRLDGGTTVASQTATAGSAPIDNVRSIYALAMMGVGVVVSLVTAGILWRRLSGVKTAFEQDSQLAETLEETRWTSLER